MPFRSAGRADLPIRRNGDLVGAGRAFDGVARSAMVRCRGGLSESGAPLPTTPGDLSGDPELIAAARDEIRAALLHDDWSRLSFSTFSPAECAYYEGVPRGL